MLFVSATTLTAAYTMTTQWFPQMMATGVPAQVVKGALSMVTTIFVVTCVLTLLVMAHPQHAGTG